jgi:hypothetical protein
MRTIVVVISLIALATPSFAAQRPSLDSGQRYFRLHYHHLIPNQIKKKSRAAQYTLWQS